MLLPAVLVFYFYPHKYGKKIDLECESKRKGEARHGVNLKGKEKQDMES